MRKLYFILFCVPFLSFSCGKESIVEIPDEGYDWPSEDRDYWPTDAWRTSPLTEHNIDPDKMALADEFAQNDPLARSLLVIKDGYIVFENYYGEGGSDESTNLWSCTKSVTSALVGFMYDDMDFRSTDQLMSELMPDYPEFGDITLHHVLTMTTGLSWNEEGPLWVDWIFSDDWVAAALARGHFNDPGKEFYYSSGNSHFLTSLVYELKGGFPGEIAQERLFDPLGIPFELHDADFVYTSWDQYREPASQTWRKDNRGIECASFGLYLTARDMAKFGYLYLNRGYWEGEQIISEEWVDLSTRDHVQKVYERYSYGYQWYLTHIDGHLAFLASGFGGQIIGVIPSLDLVVVLKYEAEDPVHPVPGTDHYDMGLFEMVAEAVDD